MRSMIRGAAAGTIATGLMSTLMLGAKRAGMMGGMPPEKITAGFLDRIDIHPSREQQDALATAFHFAFGAGAGVLFELGVRRVPLPPVPLGLAYGTAIWAVSYMGWVPALGIMPPAQRDRIDRQCAMLLGHLVYGGTLGALARRT